MLPWRPRSKAYTGVTVYCTSPETGLVVRHTERWSISALDAFASVLLPEGMWPAAVAGLSRLLPCTLALGLCAPSIGPAEALRLLPATQRGPDPSPLLADSLRSRPLAP